MIRFSANAAVWEYSTFEIDTTSIELDDSLFDPLRDNSPYNTLPPPIPVDSVITRYPNWIGLYRYGNKHVLVESDWDPSLVINMSALEPWEAFEHMYHYEDPMKSLHDEIRTYVRDKEDGFDFIVSEANDFIRASRGFHRTNGAISLKNERFYHG